MNENTEQLLEKMDKVTLEHCLSTRELARDIEQIYDLGNTFLSEAALLHGIGKIYLSKQILDKPDGLSPFERKIANLYPYYSYEILKENDFNKNIREIVLFHKGLTPPHLGIIPECSDLIWPYAKILGSLSTYAALSANRGYREAFSPQQAYDLMVKEGNHHEAVMKYIREQFL